MKNLILLFLLTIYSTAVLSQESNTAIDVKISGQGKPVLFIPGFTVPGEVWHTTVENLKKDYECHVITLAGFGGKQPIEFPWLPKVNEAIKDYIIKNKLQNATIIGHSLGGTIATWLASQDDLTLSKIIVVDALPATGALMFPNFNPDDLAYESPYNNQQLAMSDTEFEQLSKNMSKGMSLKAKAQEQIKNWIIESDRKTYVFGYTDYLKLDLRENLKNISIPVKILAADLPYGKSVITETYKKQYANLSNYDLVIAENSAHFIMLDKPQWFINQIQNILSSK